MIKIRSFYQIIVTLSLLILFSIAWLDQPLALWIDRNIRDIQPLFLTLTGYAEWITGFSISKYLPGFVALTIAVLLMIFPKKRILARHFYFIGFTFLVSRLLAGTLKNLFLRTRPDAYLANEQSTGTFFIDGGNSFPSGHTAHFWGLFLPLAILFPAYRVPLLLLPVFIALARIIVNDHYLSDVLASILISVAVCFFAQNLLIKKRL